ncbi:tetratricopeptide repeat protein [Marinobacter nitratireducens]|uniref:tetratricopeptide repeat protein n=1 Tax=Marinobacter nitratireducens TaxID=1137280 RepID=UPI00068DA210|nr:tetratricopeptide repeat protein [Marinobacter nitratireducens]
MPSFVRPMAALLASAVLAGCATTMPPETSYSEEPTLHVSCRTQVQPEERLQLDVIDEKIGNDQLYAALAQLESEPLGTEQHWLRRGQLYVITGQMADARELFEALALQCDSASSHHGLGLVAMKQGRFAEGVDHLAIARKKAPISGKIRNDYGYALLQVNEIATATYELRTAFELANGEGSARQNLAVAYILGKDSAGLKWMQTRYGLTRAELEHAQKIAQRMGRSQ